MTGWSGRPRRRAAAELRLLRRQEPALPAFLPTRPAAAALLALVRSPTPRRVSSSDDHPRHLLQRIPSSAGHGVGTARDPRAARSSRRTRAAVTSVRPERARRKNGSPTSRRGTRQPTIREIRESGLPLPDALTGSSDPCATATSACPLVQARRKPPRRPPAFLAAFAGGTSRSSPRHAAALPGELALFYDVGRGGGGALLLSVARRRHPPGAHRAIGRQVTRCTSRPGRSSPSPRPIGRDLSGETVWTAGLDPRRLGGAALARGGGGEKDVTVASTP